MGRNINRGNENRICSAQVFPVSVPRLKTTTALTQKAGAVAGLLHSSDEGRLIDCLRCFVS
jgi:hypothetical protein